MRTGVDSQVLKRLREWEDRGPLPEVLDFYRGILTIQNEALGRVDGGAPAPDKEACTRRLVRGQPLLDFDDLNIEWQLVTATFKQIVSLISRHPGLFLEMPVKFGEIHSNLDVFKEAIRAWFEGSALPGGTDDGVSPALLRLAIQAALRPVLVKHRDALSGLIEQERWRRGQCPICGGSPDFAYLDREQGARWLTCSRCDAEWLFQRLECPYCGNQDHSKLAYFTDEKGLYRLYICDKCGSYLKTIDLRRSGPEVLLPLERYLTLHLDLQARDKGYGALAASPATA